jgi:excisionase family DNA binding protein
MSKAAFSVEGFCHSYSVGKTTAYEEISSGRLRAVKAGRRTLIPEQSAADWLKSLEPVSIGADIKSSLIASELNPVRSLNPCHENGGG